MKCDWNQWRVMQLPAPALPLFQSSHIRGSQRKKRKAYEKVMFLKHRIFYLKVYQQIIWSLEVWFASFCIFLYLLYLSLDHAFVFLLLLFFSWPLFCIRKWKSWGYNNSGSWANSMASLAMLLLLYEQQCGPVDCSPPGSSVHGFSRQEYWCGLPFPFPGYGLWGCKELDMTEWLHFHFLSVFLLQGISVIMIFLPFWGWGMGLDYAMSPSLLFHLAPFLYL